MTPILSGTLGPQTASSRRDFPARSTVHSTIPVERSATGGSAGRDASVDGDHRKRMRWQLAVVAIAAVGAATISVFATTRKTEQSAIPPAVASQPSPVDNQANTAEFSVMATPPNAQLYLDNALLPSNPFHSRVAKDSAVHMVRAEAPGHKSASLVMRFDRDTSNVIALTPALESSPNATPATPPAIVRELRGSSPRVAAATRARPPAPSAPLTKPNQEPPTVAAPPPAVRLDKSDPWR